MNSRWLIAVQAAQDIHRRPPVRGPTTILEDDVEQDGAAVLRELSCALGHAGLIPIQSQSAKRCAISYPDQGVVHWIGTVRLDVARCRTQNINPVPWQT